MPQIAYVSCRRVILDDHRYCPYCRAEQPDNALTLFKPQAPDGQPKGAAQ